MKPQSKAGRDYFAAPWCYLIWGAPVVASSVAGQAYQASLFSLPVTGLVWVTAVAWIGTACFINGRSCGRIHCVIDGFAFPILSVLGALNVLSVTSFSWNLFWGAFVVILTSSFAAEAVFGKYQKSTRFAARRSPDC
jgi:hypothetical protein